MKNRDVQVKRFSFLSIVCCFALGTAAYAERTVDTAKTYSISTKKLLRFTDTKEEDGKACESYSYITPSQRLQLIRHQEFMLGDILGDTLSIPPVDEAYLVETNLTECRMEDMHVSEYNYEESLEYLGENIATIKVFQYQYGAGAAHGNGHESHYVYDRDYGMRLDWEALFGDSMDFDLYVLKRVVREIADEDFLSYFKVTEQLLNFRQPGYFAITNEGLLIQYGKYEIAPGASGLPSLVVPKKVLKQYMSEEMYQKCFMTKQQVLSVKAMNDF